MNISKGTLFCLLLQTEISKTGFNPAFDVHCHTKLLLWNEKDSGLCEALKLLNFKAAEAVGKVTVLWGEHRRRWRTTLQKA